MATLKGLQEVGLAQVDGAKPAAHHAFGEFASRTLSERGTGAEYLIGANHVVFVVFRVALAASADDWANFAGEGLCQVARTELTAHRAWNAVALIADACGPTVQSHGELPLEELLREVTAYDVLGERLGTDALLAYLSDTRIRFRGRRRVGGWLRTRAAGRGYHPDGGRLLSAAAGYGDQTSH